MRILAVNDDGIHARGIRALAARLARDHDVTVVAPDSEKSAASHAITLYRPLRVTRVNPLGLENVRCYMVDGLPVDCTKVGIGHVMEGDVDLVVSGINHGSNMGSDIIYSGTVAAAFDAVIMGYHALAVSNGSYFPKYLDDTAEVAARVIASGLPVEDEGVLYNLNVPDLPLPQIRGIRAARQGQLVYEDALDVRLDPRGHEYIWMAGRLLEDKTDEDTDASLMRRGYASIVPIRYDMTARDKLNALSCKTDKIKLQ
jgi:5'-nucleotidase